LKLYLTAHGIFGEELETTGEGGGGQLTERSTRLRAGPAGVRRQSTQKRGIGGVGGR